MELKKIENPKKRKIIFVIGVCTALFIAANVFTAFAGPFMGDEKAPTKTATVSEKKVQATGLKINNKVEVFLKNQADAEKVIKQLELDLVGSYQKKAKVDITYAEKLAQVAVETEASKVSSVEQALTILKQGRVQVVTYTIKDGDNLWSIARKNDLHVEEVREANPGLNTDFIDVGQSINLVKPQPLVHITATVENTVTEEVPFTTKTEYDKSLTRGKQKIKKAGQKGSKEVTYRLVIQNGVPTKKEILAQKVLVKPVEQIVARGDKRTVKISRGEGDSGNLLWPARGAISSGYGSRWGRKHTGLDIDGNTGDPVRAAENGRVAFAGWDGEYGKMVTIKNSDGITTRYAHLSSISVRAGDNVSRGEYIGDVGSTGRSTGSHLHFEVLKNGSFQNPIGYLR